MKTKNKIIAGLTTSAVIAAGAYSLLENGSDNSVENKNILSSKMEKKLPPEEVKKISDIARQKIGGVEIVSPEEVQNKNAEKLAQLQKDYDAKMQKLIDEGYDPDKTLDDIADSMFQSFDINQTFPIDDLKVFSIADWEKKGYEVTEDPYKGKGGVYETNTMKKDGVTIKVTSSGDSISRTVYEFDDGQTVEISDNGFVEITNEEGVKTSINSTRLTDDLGLLSGNDALTSLSAEGRNDFFSDLQNTDSSEVTTVYPFEEGENNSLTQRSTHDRSGEFTDNLRTAYINDDNEIVVENSDGRELVMRITQYGDDYSIETPSLADPNADLYSQEMQEALIKRLSEKSE